jgi:PIN domain
MNGPRKRGRRQTFVFVDTNIFLDFYRDSNEATLSLLKRLEPVRDCIISTYQVEMEFLKNRQRVLVESLGKLKPQPQVVVPAIFADTGTSASLKQLNKTAGKKAELIRKRIVNLLKGPKQNDVVYQTLAEVFQSTAGHVLTRDMPIRRQIKRLAWRRFILGYPPRKTTDTSIGDALNWEWLIHCGKTLQGRLLIVSRDSDYGTSVQADHFLNDQLLQEYKDRVGPKKRIALTTRLSDALKELQVTVPQNEIDAEAESLTIRGHGSITIPIVATGGAGFVDEVSATIASPGTPDA